MGEAWRLLYLGSKGIKTGLPSRNSITPFATCACLVFCSKKACRSSRQPRWVRTVSSREARLLHSTRTSVVDRLINGRYRPERVKLGCKLMFGDRMPKAGERVVFVEIAMGWQKRISRLFNSAAPQKTAFGVPCCPCAGGPYSSISAARMSAPKCSIKPPIPFPPFLAASSRYSSIFCHDFVKLVFRLLDLDLGFGDSTPEIVFVRGSSR